MSTFLQRHRRRIESSRYRERVERRRLRNRSHADIVFPVVAVLVFVAIFVAVVSS